VWIALLFLLVVSLLHPSHIPLIYGESQRPGYGASVSSALGIRKTAEMGFDWVRIYYPEQVNEAEQYGLNALLLIGWDSPLTDLKSWGDYVYDIVSRYRGRIAAYEICNEPNLADMWHQPQHADPAEYTAFLREAYIRAKQADPNCLIVSAGMATNGNHDATALDDLEFIRGMYEAGAKPYFDVLGSHPHGFAYAPEDALSDPVHCFRRVEQQRAIMVQFGDTAKPIWATEFGWIVDPGEECHYYGDWPTRWWQRVSFQTQADYLLRAYHYARTNWPWMGVMFIWNMDFSTVSWNDYCDQKCWYALLNHDGTPRPAYSALTHMAQTQTTPEVSSNTGAITGQVSLQGRDNHWGSLVVVDGYSATTSEDGSFCIGDIPAGTYELQVWMPGYLQYKDSNLTIQGDMEITLPNILLQAGDINGDSIVNLFDLVAISTSYGQILSERIPEDVNGDGKIDLLDLVLVSTNYGTSHSEV